MTKFRETDAGRAFIASGDTRETSREVMAAIAFFACHEGEAEAIWNGDALGTACTLLDIWEHATSNGANSVNLCWGEEGEHWVSEIAFDHSNPLDVPRFSNAEHIFTWGRNSQEHWQRMLGLLKYPAEGNFATAKAGMAFTLATDIYRAMVRSRETMDDCTPADILGAAIEILNWNGED